jgi:outer membrane protein assembly factor BamA
LFVGQEDLVRGYSVESFNPSECTLVANSRGCPEFDRLVGSRIGVFNAELRIPLLGTDQLGLIPLNFLPVEIAPFFDAGVAWRSNEDPVFAFKRNTTDRVPVFSTGVTARINLFGYLVLESYYAYPFQRPERGWHFGFNLAPGW